jgi:hypothetical protein
MFWSGLATVARHSWLPSPWTVAAILAVGLFPPIFSSLGVLWKDVGLGAALLLAFGLLLHARRRSSRQALVAAIVALFYSFGLRYNAAPAVLPLSLWAGFIGVRLLRPGCPPSRRAGLAAGAAVFVLLAMLVAGANHLLVGDRRLYPAQQVMVHDLIAISLGTGVPRFPASLRADGPMTLDNLRCVYQTSKGTVAFQGRSYGCELEVFKITDQPRMADLQRTWLAAGADEPWIYLQHRVAVLRGQLALDAERVCYPLQLRPDPNSLGIEDRPTRLLSLAEQVLPRFAYETPLYRGWLYVALLLAVLVGSVLARRRIAPAGLALGASGLLFAVSYLPAATACDFRFNWWIVVAALVLPVTAWTDRDLHRPMGSDRLPEITRVEP